MPGGGKGGKAGGEFIIDADVQIDPLDITTDMVIGGGERPVASDNTVRMGGTGDPLVTEVTFGGTGTPLTTESGLRFELVKPIVTKSSTESTVDVKPVDLDLCLSFGLKELPATRIRRPYHRRFGMRVFGVEVLGFEWAGENKLDIEPRPRGAQVAWGPTVDRRRGGHSEGHAAVASGEGLRVSLES